jgi:hypothetical protein
MEKYSIHKVVHSGEEFYCIYENATNQVLDFFAFVEDATETVKSMSKGKGFDGFTPAFMLNSAVHQKVVDINKKFKEIFSK